MENLYKQKKKSLLLFIAFLGIGAVIGIISTFFDVETGNKISIPAFIFMVIGLIYLIVFISKCRQIANVRKTRQMTRNLGEAFGNDQEKYKIIIDSYKSYKSGNRNFDDVLNKVTSESPYSLIYFKYRCKINEISRIYYDFYKVGDEILLDNENLELLPVTAMLYKLTFSVICLYSRECIDESFEDLIIDIKNFLFDANPVKLNELLRKGEAKFIESYGDKKS